MGGNVWLVFAINDGRSTYTSNGAISRRGQPVRRVYSWLGECIEVLGRGGPRGVDGSMCQHHVRPHITVSMHAPTLWAIL